MCALLLDGQHARLRRQQVLLREIVQALRQRQVADVGGLDIVVRRHGRNLLRAHLHGQRRRARGARTCRTSMHVQLSASYAEYGPHCGDCDTGAEALLCWKTTTLMLVCSSAGWISNTLYLLEVRGGAGTIAEGPQVVEAHARGGGLADAEEPAVEGGVAPPRIALAAQLVQQRAVAAEPLPA